VARQHFPRIPEAQVAAVHHLAFALYVIAPVTPLRTAISRE